MGQLSAKLRNLGTEQDRRVAFWCPGCEGMHNVRVAGQGATWSWDNSVDAPTFAPSILVTYYKGESPSGRCHSFVRAGVIEFLGDCTHHLAGQSVPLPDLPAGFRD